MAEIRHVITDMDGTIVPTMGHEVSDRVRQTIVRVEERGVVVSVVTARPYDLAKGALNLLGLEGPSVFDGGATVADAKTGETLWTRWLDVGRVQQAVDILLPHATTIDYTPGYNEVSVDESGNVPAAVEPAPYVFARVETANIEAIQNQLEALPDIAAHVITLNEAGLSGIQITDCEADKFHGVTALRELVGVTKEQTLAIGDGDNDITLFANAGTKIAMGNATEKLKAAADEIVASLEQDGFAEAMERHVLK